MTSSIALNPELDLRDDGSKRLCWVCFGTEQDDENSNDENLKVVWICPCQCRGTMKWVHDECLQRWIDEKQKRTNSPRVSCSQCKTNYILSFPPVNCLVGLLDRYDKFLYSSSPIVTTIVVVGSIYGCCAFHGFLSIIQVMGLEEGRRAINESDMLFLVIALPTIPLALILAKLIKWENSILQLWRHSTFNYPRPLSYIIDKPPAQYRANCDQILLDPEFDTPHGFTRMTCGALLLPSVAALVGKILFSKMSGPQWRRSLIGGIAFLLFKGAMKIYLRKSQYVRYSQRTIKNYVPPDRSLSDSSGEDFGSPATSSGTSGESDDDSQQSRPRTMFSMTIRL